MKVFTLILISILITLNVYSLEKLSTGNKSDNTSSSACAKKQLVLKTNYKNIIKENSSKIIEYCFFIKKAMPFYSYLKSSKLMYIYGRKRKPFASHCLAVLSVYLSDNLAVKYE